MFEIAEEQESIINQAQRFKSISPQNEFLKQGGHCGDLGVIFSEDQLRLHKGSQQNTNFAKEVSTPQKYGFISEQLIQDQQLEMKKINQKRISDIDNKNIQLASPRGDSSRLTSSNHFFEKKTQSILKKNDSSFRDIQFSPHQDNTYDVMQKQHSSIYMKSKKKVNLINQSNDKINQITSQNGEIDKTEKTEIKSLEFNLIKLQQKEVKQGIHYEKSRTLLKTIQSKQEKQKELKDNERNERALKIIKNILSNSMDKVKRIDYQAKRFGNILMISSGLRNYVGHLEKQHLQCINDKSAFYQREKHHFSLQKLANSFSSNILVKIFDFHIKSFMPTETFRILWDLSQVIFTIVFLYLYSILIFCAQQEIKQENSEYIEYFFYFAFFLFSIDVLVNFNTAYFKKDLIITNHSSIAQKYLSSYFFTDITAVIVIGQKVIFKSIPLVYNPQNDLLIHLRNTLLFLKAVGITSKRKRIESVITLKNNQKHLLKLFNLLTSIMIVAHIIGIGWNVVEIVEKNYGIENTWTVKYNIPDQDWLAKYIFSFYWSVTTMTTVGFGDITPANQYEALFLSATMIFLSCIFAYSINNIGMILQEIERSQKELTDNVSTIQNYLTRKNVNIALKSRVRHYLHFLADEEKDRNKEVEDKVFLKLSNKLRDEITLEVNTKILNSSSIFTKNFSVTTLNKIVFKMVEKIISPNEVIFKEGDFLEPSIYFIFSGCIEIYYSTETIKKGQSFQSNIYTKRLQGNQIFGEISFFSGLPRSACAKSVNLSTIYQLSQKDFIEIIQENSEDYERFKMIQDQIGLECYCCNQHGHIAAQCNVIHKRIDKQCLILKQNFSMSQNRANTKQRQKHRIKPLMCLVQNKNAQRLLKEQIHQQSVKNQKGDDCSDDVFEEDDSFTNSSLSSNYSNPLEDEEDDNDANEQNEIKDVNQTISNGKDQNQIEDIMFNSNQNYFYEDKNIIMNKFLMVQSNQESEQKGQIGFDGIKLNEEDMSEDKQINKQTSFQVISPTLIQAEKITSLSNKKIESERSIEENKSRNTTEKIDTSYTNIQTSLVSLGYKNNLFEKQISKKGSKRGNESINLTGYNIGTTNSLATSDNDIVGRGKKEENFENYNKIKSLSQKQRESQKQQNGNDERQNDLATIKQNGMKLASDECATSILQNGVSITVQDLTKLLCISTSLLQKQYTKSKSDKLIEDKEQTKDMEYDSAKLFKKFFPHNNFDVVLKDIKQIQQQRRKEIKEKQKQIYQSKNRRQNIFNNNIESPLQKKSMYLSRTSMFNKQSQHIINNQEDFKTSSIQYGYFSEQKKTIPITFYSLEQQSIKN